MKLLSKEKGEIWVRNHDLPTGGRTLRTFYKYSFVYERRLITTTEIFLAKQLLRYFGTDKKENALWITQWELSSNENMNLYTGFLKSLNEKRNLNKASFFVFNKTDLNNVECLLDLALFFMWDTYLISPNRKLVVSPNDEFIHVSCGEEKNAKDLRELFKLMKFKEETKWFSKLPKTD
ncbi:MAG TPA: hypothetical protein VIJ93_09920 [bacterium]